jgi:hypothetical protein
LEPGRIVSVNETKPDGNKVDRWGSNPKGILKPRYVDGEQSRDRLEASQVDVPQRPLGTRR